MSPTLGGASSGVPTKLDFLSVQRLYTDGERRLIGTVQYLLFSLRSVVINVTAEMDEMNGMCQFRIKARAQPNSSRHSCRTASSMLL